MNAPKGDHRIFGAYMAGRAAGLRDSWIGKAREARGRGRLDASRECAEIARKYSRDRLSYLRWVSR